jgi:hypothetical protein
VRSRETIAGLVVELAMFLCSYAPLFAILAIRFQTEALTITCALIAVAGLAASGLVLWRFHELTASSWTVRSVRDRGGEVAGYLASYLLPFVMVPQPSVRDLVGYLLFGVIVAVIYIRSSLIQVNPTLYLFGWRLCAIEIGDGWSGYLLTRIRLADGQPVNAVRMSERLFISYQRASSGDAG